MGDKCGICGSDLLTDRSDPKFGHHPSTDCGGDCLSCMAVFDDPECKLEMEARKFALQEASEVFARRGLYGDELLAHWAKTGKIT